MAVVWQHPGLTVSVATEFVNENRLKTLSERTIATILRRLDTKGYVVHAVDGRSYLYTATVPEREFVTWHGRRAMSELVDRYGEDVAIAGIVERAAADGAVLQHLTELINRRSET